ncbi:hypothetical protein PCL_12180 [Purpureocillium lilacinum]|uniref:Uncharacterized protein n=1 Tax=Purpureocillium lilacinum TaxID=33203 RepID=A0A2U3E8I9_PURLI|nr:hypothetical protein PCL_12180 [Purpureocillium lilacinum]
MGGSDVGKTDEGEKPDEVTEQGDGYLKCRNAPREAERDFGTQEVAAEPTTWRRRRPLQGLNSLAMLKPKDFTGNPFFLCCRVPSRSSWDDGADAGALAAGQPVSDYSSRTGTQCTRHRPGQHQEQSIGTEAVMQQHSVSPSISRRVC